jgi:hypothetical protein
MLNARTFHSAWAAVALHHVAHYNAARAAHDASEGAWTGCAQLVDAALAVAPALPTETPPDRRRKLTVIEGGKS